MTASVFSGEFWSSFFDLLYPEYNYKYIPTPSLMNIDLIFIGLYVAIVLAAVALCTRKAVMGRAVRAILKAEAFSPETAKTASELGLGKSRILSYALRHRKFGLTVRRTDVDYDALFASMDAEEKRRRKKTAALRDIPYTEEEMQAARAAFFKKKHTPEEEAALRYYIPEAERYSAEDRYSRRGSDIRTAILVALIFIPVLMVIRFFLPELLQLADNAVAMIIG